MPALVLNDEQQMLKDAAKRFFSESAPVSQLRSLRDSRDDAGFSRELWQSMVEMGFAGTLIDEAFGGSAFGSVGMGQVFEQAGRNLSASPLFSSGVLCASLIALAGSEQQQAELLGAIASGSLLMALALDERPRHAPSVIETRAEPTSDGFVLNGSKRFVVDGHVADKLIVVARMADGLGLFLVPRDAAGVSLERRIMADSRNAAAVRLENVRVAEADRLAVGDAQQALDRALDLANAQLAAELLGISLEAFERTVAYLQERKQFGVVIGSFQALQHRAAHMFSELELVKSVVLKALTALDAADPDAASLVSLAKAKSCEVAELVTNEAIQLHGGMGMTDEFDIGLFIKRARVVQHLLGDYRFHADRFARLRGY
jgi:alkylation response protein AidB-like acyl-CoA dehydrogenase